MTCSSSSINDHSSSPFPWSHLSKCVSMTQIEFASLSSLFVLGGFIGAMSAGPFSSVRGKLLVMQCAAVSYILGSTVQTLAGTVLVMQLARFIVGLGAGVSTVIVPMYISEIAQPEQRGFFGSFTQISINLGILFTQGLGYFLSRPFYWRGIMSFGVVLALGHLILLLFASESPAWLAAHVDSETAMKVLRRIRPHSYDLQSEAAHFKSTKKITDDVDASADSEQPLLSRQNTASTSDDHEKAHIGFTQLLKDNKHRRAVLAVVGMMVIQQATGINGVILYSVSLLKGVIPISSALLTIFISLVNLFCTIGCSNLPDRLGRKATLLISISGMGISSFLLATGLQCNVQILSALSVLGFVAFFAAGLGPVPFGLASEMIEPEAKGALQSLALGASYAATFVIAQGFPILNSFMNNLVGGVGSTFFIFAGTAALSVWFVFAKVPETRGRSVEEVWGREERLD